MGKCKHTFVLTEDKPYIKNGYCGLCFRDMLIFNDGRIGVYNSHNAAINKGLWGKRKPKPEQPAQDRKEGLSEEEVL